MLCDHCGIPQQFKHVHIACVIEQIAALNTYIRDGMMSAETLVDEISDLQLRLILLGCPSYKIPKSWAASVINLEGRKNNEDKLSVL